MSTLEIRLTTHAIDRFHERRPGLTRAAAEDEFARLVLLGALVTEPPSWFAARERRHAPAYLVIGDVVLPLALCHAETDTYYAVTCIARGGISDAARFRRRERQRCGRP